MTKADIVNSISDNVGVEKKETQKVVEAFMDEVRKALQSGNNVYLRGFGTFQIKQRKEKKLRSFNLLRSTLVTLILSASVISLILVQRKEKKGRNITSNTTVTIPAHNIPAFKPSKEFVVAVKNNVEIK